MTIYRYKNLMPHDLQREAMKGLLRRTNYPQDKIGYVVVGTVIQVCCCCNFLEHLMLFS